MGWFIGGNVSGAIDTAAQIAATGLEQLAWKYLTTKDDVERNLILELAMKVGHEYSPRKDKNLANAIASEVSKMFKR